LDSGICPIVHWTVTVGAQFVVSSWLFPSGAGSQPTLDDYKKMAARINEIEQAAQHGSLQYVYHNHNFELKALRGHKIGYDVSLAETDPAVIDFELDCG
jgi:hypothetical protein